MLTAFTEHVATGNSPRVLDAGCGTGRLTPTVTAAGRVVTGVALFGASYIGLTGLIVLWSTRLYPDRTSFGVGLGFFTIAAGQALGAPLVGNLIKSINATTVFYTLAPLAILGATLRPRPATPRAPGEPPPVLDTINPIVAGKCRKGGPEWHRPVRALLALATRRSRLRPAARNVDRSR